LFDEILLHVSKAFPLLLIVNVAFFVCPIVTLPNARLPERPIILVGVDVGAGLVVELLPPHALAVTANMATTPHLKTCFPAIGADHTAVARRSGLDFEWA
jgi:hypothetical protein